MTIRECNEWVWRAFFIFVVLPSANHGDERKLSRSQFDSSGKLTISTFYFEITCFNVRFRATNDDAAYHEKRVHKPTLNFSQFFGILVAFNTNLPRCNPIIIIKLSPPLIHIGLNGFLHNSDHLEGLGKKFLVQSLLGLFEIGELESEVILAVLDHGRDLLMVDSNMLLGEVGEKSLEITLKVTISAFDGGWLL